MKTFTQVKAALAGDMKELARAAEYYYEGRIREYKAEGNEKMALFNSYQYHQARAVYYTHFAMDSQRAANDALKREWCEELKVYDNLRWSSDADDAKVKARIEYDKAMVDRERWLNA